MNNKMDIQWFKQNALQLIIIIVTIIIAWASMNARVSANAEDIASLQRQIGQYPSADYFDLKFQDITDKLNSLQTQVDSKLNTIQTTVNNK